MCLWFAREEGAEKEEEEDGKDMRQLYTTRTTIYTLTPWPFLRSSFPARPKIRKKTKKNPLSIGILYWYAVLRNDPVPYHVYSLVQTPQRLFVPPWFWRGPTETSWGSISGLISFHLTFTVTSSSTRRRRSHSLQMVFFLRLNPPPPPPPLFARAAPRSQTRNPRRFHLSDSCHARLLLCPEDEAQALAQALSLSLARFRAP